MATKDKQPIGRPTTYSQETADSICEYIAMGYSLRKVCEQDGMPVMSTIFKWIREHDDFSKQYARATEERTEAMAEDILDIADDGTNDWVEDERKDGSTYWRADNDVIQRSRLRVDTRKWLMAKMKPKKYGDKLDMTTNGKDLPTPLLSGLSRTNLNDDIIE